MKCHRSSSLCVLALLALRTLAQFGTWDEHQVNTSICSWEQPRAALIRDTIYLDGGDIWWSPGFDDGTYGTPINQGNYEGLVLTYNLSNPFSTATNVTGLLLQAPESKARGGIGNTNGASPNFHDGAMLANDAEFFLYGGAAFRNDEQSAPLSKGWVLGYQVYQYGPDKPLWKRGFRDLELPDGVHRYIAYGGAVNAPSENKAWYFSGLTSATQGPIYSNWNATTRPANVSNTLISVDMSKQLYEKWSNSTLPSNVKGRANAEVVWVPVGEQGILVVLGGVVYPEWITAVHKSENATASERESPEFMRTIDIYDIVKDKWYKQPTKDGGPGARTRGCAVVAPASDYSSFNIYYYGGYDGLHPLDPFYDDVWVLSIPSFTWTQVNKGTSLHARAGHKCFMPYPNQMMAFGGYTARPGTGMPCLDQGPVVIFNLTSGEWMDSYDPTKHSDYGVHEKVQAVIGGDASGGATATKPVPSGWATSALGDIFATAYDQKKITTYWPYNPVLSTERPALPPGNRGESGLPSWVGPVLGVVLGLVFITIILVMFCLWRRRGIFRSRSSDSSTLYGHRRIVAWLKGQPPTTKTATVTSEESPSSPEMEGAATLALTHSISASVVPLPPSPQEMPDTQVSELDPDNTRVELHDTGLTPLELYQRYSYWFQMRNGTLPSPSDSSVSMSGYPHSPVSSIARDQIGGTPRIDSPPLGYAYPVVGRSHPPPVPELNEDDSRPLEPIPEASNPTSPVETLDKKCSEQSKKTEGGGQDDVVSPPTTGEIQGEDYLSVTKLPSPSTLTRKGVLQEDEDDTLGKLG